MAIQIDVVVVVIDRVDEKVSFVHFVGMLVGIVIPLDETWWLRAGGGGQAVQGG